jgi:hypothetical protein
MTTAAVAVVTLAWLGLALFLAAGHANTATWEAIRRLEKISYGYPREDSAELTRAADSDLIRASSELVWIQRTTALGLLLLAVEGVWLLTVWASPGWGARGRTARAAVYGSMAGAVCVALWFNAFWLAVEGWENLQNRALGHGVLLFSANAGALVGAVVGAVWGAIPRRARPGPA